MPGGRGISGADVLAQLERFGPPTIDRKTLRHRLGARVTVASIDDLLRICPPATIGLTDGQFAALVAPLFGEFE